MRRKLILLFSLLSLSVLSIISCKDKATAVTPEAVPELTVEKKESPKTPSKLSKGKGQVSFKVNGRLYETDPNRTKCWTVASSPHAMLMAYGEGFTVSWQTNYPGENTPIHVDRDNKGGISFKIDGVSYGVVSRGGDNYLDVVYTGSTDKFSIIMLSGTFSGVLEDYKGNKIEITEGKFITEDI